MPSRPPPTPHCVPGRTASRTGLSCAAPADRPRRPRSAFIMSVRRALVTGGSRGIGAAVAAALAGSGHVVAVHYRTGRARAEAVLAGRAGGGGGGLGAHPA